MFKTRANTLIVITIAAAVLLLPALAAWITGWQWTPAAKPWTTAAVLVTDTAGFPVGIATCAVLAALFVAFLRPVLTWPRGAIALVLVCAAAIAFGQGVKTAGKNVFQQPRPYVEWLAQNHGITSGQFYALTRGERAAWLRETITNEQRVAPVLREHWMDETGFSFPSGHTSFVAVWALLGAALLWRRGAGSRIFCGVLMVWALLVEITRLALGMHWPADVAASIVAGWLIVAGMVWLGPKIALADDSKKSRNATA